MSSELIQSIKAKLYNFRGNWVMLDSDLAEYYGVETKRLNEAVKRNKDLFPSDFMFQLTESESNNLKSQIATASFGHGGRRNPPYVFTEKGSWTISFILRNSEANQKGIQLIRILEQLRDFAVNHTSLMGPGVQSQVTNPTSVINHFHSPVVIHQQGNHNNQVINQAELLVDLFKLRNQAKDGLQEKLDTVIEAVAKGDKASAMKTVKSITDVAKAGTALYKLGEQLATLIGPFLS